MFIEDWNSFYDQAESLYKNDPLKTRYVLKYIHKSRKLVLKVTDDKVVCVLYCLYDSASSCLLWDMKACFALQSYLRCDTSSKSAYVCAVLAIPDRPAA